jgi:predicted metal-dependent hydrolase
MGVRVFAFGTPAFAHAQVECRQSCDDRCVSRPLQIVLPFDSAQGRPFNAVQATPSTASPSDPLAPVYFVRHRRARRYLLRIEPDGRLRVTIPRGGSKREAQEFAARNIGWVVRQRARAQTSTYTADERDALRARAMEELPVRLHELAALHGVAGVTRVSIRSQRTRWGSCARDGHICLNWRLVVMPEHVRDYVLIHELMHLRRLDHSPAYWRLVAAACPDYAAARAWLRTHGQSLR